ncbi:2-hydroxyacid dehydrogenase [Alteromonas sp. ASW11-36]|uniref:2-hydroxyacid dehydrogenase n=1 Tax=Alteromonas arenosi TaxID=3055817 RepID=A0ABT7SXY2_9ALTE|nr:2-hydroxyacid dehydrogenase [Alteromonas sp. ASW11-36]MDM7861031.1 2-hydroxyacid dehydrogenase [Alteromonas sp. ASW11-36]
MRSADASRIAFFSSKRYDQEMFEPLAQASKLHIDFKEPRLDQTTAPLAAGAKHVCVFVNDEVNTSVVEQLASLGVEHIALRCAGYNNVDIESCRAAGIRVSHVPTYSPEAVAEHAMALILTLNRKMHKAYNRVKEGNFALQGLLGFTMHGKTIGIIGTGNIGKAFVRIALGFGCKVLCFDPYPDPSIISPNCQYVELSELFAKSDIISLHCPLMPQTQHIINTDSIAQMKPGVMVINTSRGGLIDTAALIKGLKSKHIGFVGLDVYEMESELFFRDRSCEVIQDDLFQRLSTFHNVLITGHQGFFTIEAVTEIANTTLANILNLNQGQPVAARFL